MLVHLGIWLSVETQLKSLREQLERLPQDDPNLPDFEQDGMAVNFWWWQRVCHDAGFTSALVPLQHLVGSLEDNKKREPRLVGRPTPAKILARLAQFRENLY